MWFLDSDSTLKEIKKIHLAHTMHHRKSQVHSLNPFFEVIQNVYEEKQGKISLNQVKHDLCNQFAMQELTILT